MDSGASLTRRKLRCPRDATLPKVLGSRYVLLTLDVNTHIEVVDRGRRVVVRYYTIHTSNRRFTFRSR